MHWREMSLLPLVVLAKWFKSPFLLRITLSLMCREGAREQALELAVDGMSTTNREGAQWFRDHVVPDELRGEAWERYEGAA